ncbi:MAG: lytic transglycosylase domain-containing protein, partial [Acetanaerobacterium sp.]
LGYLKRQFENEQCMLSAYHAGISRVMDWLGNEEYSSDGVHLDTIPFTDTAHYVNKVGKALAAYERMP